MIEEKIWDEFRAGSIAAFEKLYDFYSTQLYRYGRNFSNEEEIIEDCIQELFTGLWEKKERIGATTSVRFYLLRSMRRMLHRRLQQEIKNSSFPEDTSFEMESSPEQVFILTESDRKLQGCLLRALNGLTARQREVIFLRYYQGLSFDEIAEITDFSKKTAYNLVFIALGTLRKNTMIAQYQF